MNIADYTATRILCAVREDKLAKIKHGSKLKATVPALGDKAIELSVVKMKDMGSYATWKATKPRNEHDLRTFELTLKPTTSIEGLLPGMTVVLDKGQL